jgi:hypothetical protein
VIFYYNDIPAKTTVTMKFDDLKALPKLREAPPLSHPALTVNGQPIRLPVTLGRSEAVTVDTRGRCTLWPRRPAQPQRLEAKAAPILLQPGANRLELTCDTTTGAPRDVTVRVVRLAR